jgi:tetratricopeptide (TPR) repeat protein
LPYVLNYWALVAYYQNDLDRAAELWQESLAQTRGPGDDRQAIGYSLYGLGVLSLAQGDYAAAHQHLEESLALYRAEGDKRYIAALRFALGRLAQAQGDHAQAMAQLKESLLIRKKTGARRGLAETLEGIAGVMPQADRAAQLLGAAQALREAIGAPVPPVERADADRQTAHLRAQLGENGFTAAWSEGQAMPLEQAIGQALEEIPA